MNYRLIHADVFAGLAELADESVHFAMTSPPYWQQKPPYCAILNV